MTTASHTDGPAAFPMIGKYTYEEFLNAVEQFHGYKAPGVVMGGIMAAHAMRQLSKDTLFDAISETAYCLPDAIQLLTPCTIGNGWLKVISLGRYALSLYDKYHGNGIRVFVDSEKIKAFSEIYTWFFKLKPKKEQNTELLMEQIKQAGSNIYTVEPVQILSPFLQKRHKGDVAVCPLCGEGYPRTHGRICRACQGQSPYQNYAAVQTVPEIQATPAEAAIGQKLLHDMTEIIPETSKGPAFKKGHILSAGDLCQLHRMGKRHVYVDDGHAPSSDEWVHENDAALSFAKAMAGQGVQYAEPPSEGKVNFTAAIDGLLIINKNLLEAFNQIPGVMCATRHNFMVVRKGQKFAGTRAIPLYIARSDFEKAMKVLTSEPLFHVTPLRKAKIGILVTGSEVFRGLIQDRFIPIIRAKAEAFGCNIVHTKIVPDDRTAISENIQAILERNADIIVTTAGLSVDPDDVTRQGLADAGAEDMLYGAPILPGAMTLLAHIGNVQLIGVPACALHYKTTSFDLLFPRLLADIPVTRTDLSQMGHGAFCMECKACSFPKCPFGK